MGKINGATIVRFPQTSIRCSTPFLSRHQMLITQFLALASLFRHSLSKSKPPSKWTRCINSLHGSSKIHRSMVIPQNLLEISGKLNKLDLVSLIRKNSLKSSQSNSLHSSNNSHRLSISINSSKNSNSLLVIPQNLLIFINNKHTNKKCTNNSILRNSGRTKKLRISGKLRRKLRESGKLMRKLRISGKLRRKLRESVKLKRKLRESGKLSRKLRISVKLKGYKKKTSRELRVSGKLRRKRISGKLWGY